VNPFRPFLRFLFYLVQALAGYGSVFGDALRYGGGILNSPPVRQVFFRQIYFSGIEALPLLSVAALALGFGGLNRLNAVLGGDLEQTLDVFRALLVQASSVFVVALYVLARSASAMAAELAGLKQNGELRALYRLGIDPGAYIVAPRVWAMMASVSALTVYFQIIMVFGGLALMSLTAGWDYYFSLEIFLRGIEPGDALLTVGRSMALGATVAVVACQQGLRAVMGPRGVPVATRTAVVHGFTSVLVIDILFALIFFQ